MRILPVIAISGMLLIPSVPSQADGGDFFAGVIAGVIGAKVVDSIIEGNNNNSQSTNNNTRPTRTVTRTTRPSQAELQRRAAAAELREQNRHVQTWLNQLGFNVGSVDGKFGPRTRGAIGDFQVSIEHARTEVLSPQEMVRLEDYANGNAMRTDPLPVIDANVTPQQSEPTLPNGIFPPIDSGLPDSADITALNRNDGLASQSFVFGDSEQVSTTISQITVLGLSPLSSADDVEDSIASNNYDNCDFSNVSVYCEKDSAFMKDTLLVGFLSHDGNKQIHTIRREMIFKGPVQRDAILQQLSEPYPGLVSASDLTLASTAECVSYVRPLKDRNFVALQAWTNALEPKPQSGPVSEMADMCNYHYSLSIADSDQVDQVSITLFAGAPIIAALADSGASSGGLQNAQIQF